MYFAGLLESEASPMYLLFADLRTLIFLHELLNHQQHVWISHYLKLNFCHLQCGIPGHSRSSVIPGRVEIVILNTDVSELFEYVCKQVDILILNSFQTFFVLIILIRYIPVIQVGVERLILVVDLFPYI